MGLGPTLASPPAPLISRFFTVDLKRDVVLDLVQRARAVVMSPAAEWRTIEGESGDPLYLFANYAAILAAIEPICALVRHALFEHRAGFFSSLFWAVVHYLFALAVVYAMALIIDSLAPTFSGRTNRESALKLSVYSMTPAWLAGVFALIPGLEFVPFFALLYSLYVFWLGLPVLMEPPPDRAVHYALAVLVCWIALMFVVSAIVGPVV